jgi:F-type H+-transporting ATPase subunit gamma
MPSIKDLKKRITTVKNTQQTTRAMKMVSAAKLRRAQEAIQNQRPFANRLVQMIRELSLSLEGKISHPLMEREKELGDSNVRKVLLVVVTSDRGLCGGFNGNVIKSCQRWIKTAEGQGASVELVFVGKKGHDFFKNRKVKLGGVFPELSGKVTFAKAKKLAEILIDRYLKEDVNEVKFIYNEFKNAVTQQVVVEDFLPIKAIVRDDSAVAGVSTADQRPYIVKPSQQELLEELLSKNFSVQTFKVLLESQAGEHGARMSAMENATKNAGEMIRKLTLQYNKQRQAGITKELLEIISGSESQKR